MNKLQEQEIPNSVWNTARDTDLLFILNLTNYRQAGVAAIKAWIQSLVSNGVMSPTSEEIRVAEDYITEMTGEMSLDRFDMLVRQGLIENPEIEDTRNSFVYHGPRRVRGIYNGREVFAYKNN